MAERLTDPHMVQIIGEVLKILIEGVQVVCGSALVCSYYSQINRFNRLGFWNNLAELIKMLLSGPRAKWCRHRL